MRIVYIYERVVNLVSKSMLYEEKRDSRIRRAIVNHKGLYYCLFLCTSVTQTGKGSHCFIQLGPLNPLEECMSQFPETSQGCHMELLNEKLVK